MNNNITVVEYVYAFCFRINVPLKQLILLLIPVYQLIPNIIIFKRKVLENITSFPCKPRVHVRNETWDAQESMLFDYVIQSINTV